jgi:transmembrane sensor
MSVQSGAPTRETPRDAAAAWHVRLQSDGAQESDWLDFEAWLSAAPEHLEAYDAVESLWADLDEANIEPSDNVTPLRRRTATRPPAWMAMAASLVVAAGAGLIVWNMPGPLQTYETKPGETRTVTLADGSTVTLNSGSHIGVRMSPRERRVEMADAEAVFDVAHNPNRPFLIEAGDRQIRVVGTQFNVLHHDGDVAVTVNRGIVEVRPNDQTSGPALARLEKGQSLSHREGETADKIALADPKTAMAWTEGRLVFQGERLDQVVRTLNRYVATPIVVDRAAAGLPVTATLTIGPEDQMLDSLAAFLPVEFRRQTDRVRVSLRD